MVENQVGNNVKVEYAADLNASTYGNGFGMKTMTNLTEEQEIRGSSLELRQFSVKQKFSFAIFKLETNVWHQYSLDVCRHEIQHILLAFRRFDASKYQFQSCWKA